MVAVIASALVGSAWDGLARVLGIVAGLWLAVTGGWMALRGTVDLGRSFTPLPRPRDGATLVRTGIYARVRHPIYGGIVIGSFGWGLLWASPPGLVLAVVAWAFFTVKSMREEAWLVERFPDYAGYRRVTGRFLPPIRPGRSG